MPHFFIKANDVNGDMITISDKENYNHIVNSLRVKVGEILKFIDENSIVYTTNVLDISSSVITSKIIASKKSIRSLPYNLYLAQSPLRNNDAQNFAIEKATELGIKGIYPIYTDNCVLNTSVIGKKIVKWQKTMNEAAKQCERADIPLCFDMCKIEDLIHKFDEVIVFCERDTDKTLKEIKLPKNGEDVLVIIGPEGGFSKREFDYFAENNLNMLTLGNMILRAETAVTVGLGNIIYEFNSKN